MLRYRGLVLGLVVVLLTSTMTQADDPKKDEPKERPGRIEIPIPHALGSLLPNNAIEKLKLTDEQKKKVEKIEAEYQEKMKELTVKFVEMARTGDQDKIREAKAQYQDYLIELLRKSGFVMDKLSISQKPSETQVPIYTRLPFTVRGMATTESIVDMLYVFQNDPNLQLRNLSIVKPYTHRPGAPDNSLDVTMTVDVLVQNRITENRKLRTDFLGKIEGILTDEQKKMFKEIKRDSLARIPQDPGGSSQSNRPIPQIGDVLSKPAQERLKLTDEQKKKIEALQKEVEAKVQSILNDEQKKQLKEMPPLPSPPPPGKPGGEGK